MLLAKAVSIRKRRVLGDVTDVAIASTLADHYESQRIYLGHELGVVFGFLAPGRGVICHQQSQSHAMPALKLFGQPFYVAALAAPEFLCPDEDPVIVNLTDDERHRLELVI
jgi:hypothetical protein